MEAWAMMISEGAWLAKSPDELLAVIEQTELEIKCLRREQERPVAEHLREVEAALRRYEARDRADPQAGWHAMVASKRHEIKQLCENPNRWREHLAKRLSWLEDRIELARALIQRLKQENGPSKGRA